MSKSHPVYQCISPLRGLLLKTTQPKLFQVTLEKKQIHFQTIGNKNNGESVERIAIQRTGEPQRVEKKVGILERLPSQRRRISPQGLPIIRSVYPGRNPLGLRGPGRQFLRNQTSQQRPATNPRCVPSGLYDVPQLRVEYEPRHRCQVARSKSIKSKG